jgi:hypothetical protein
MPWNSSKSDISTKHHVFVALHDWLVTVVGDYARISRTWMGEWPEKVFAYEAGDVVPVTIEDFITARKSFLPDAPKSRPRLAERIASKNQRLAKRKPWVKALYEGVVAATVVSRQPLEQANWFAFNLLDLTLTSALRAYLVNELEPGAKEKDLKALLRLVPRIQPGLKAMIPLSEDLWVGIENLARRRDDLTYGRAEPVITDADLSEAKDLVETILKKLHRIHLDD